MSLTDPPMQEVQTLLQALQPHAEEFGFFLHWGRFCQHIAGVSPPAPVLRMSVYVWGAHLRGPSSSTLHEADFLQRALSYTTLPPEEHLNEVVEVAQAHVLLSTYFFRQDRVTEGHYHLGIAVSLVMAVRMHKVGPVSVGGVSTGSTQPVGQVDEGERIRAFWTVFFLSTCWSASSNLGSAITSDNGAQVDAPWPLEMSQYGRTPAKRS
ncbi:uncharacterized protein SCHCODRAFT_02596857 [Schizophyllum commune H4-8]|uniref:Xylanolytic transcriptional activator regulatory domain-containing protein n=1 Tax=Schizophyllum commune (strain H4-8 / FGSC 9210) TaxID=578458 RepID=D8PPT2_SCHCM|nr:uncharacterized protein SCHCODRAFT_02596857 [Schizophyllum commune H4-8]KAI5898315.1 hypothetical protein SCHCODRAFT_02596857 [Schizophyllum commune H4-8]